MTTHPFELDTRFSGMSRDPNSRVWLPLEGTRTIGYSSDAYARGKLLSVINNASDLSSLSGELHSQATSWPAKYYLSAERANLLRPFSWNRRARVLEVGSGCGSITRFLGETFDDVVAVEGELHRAEVGASRCRDQPNVHVVCANHRDLPRDQLYDVIFCIGVLEYSPVFSDSNDPMGEMLTSMRDRLAPGGVLVIAIENQIGLKYFSGAAEDHTGIAYDGIEGYRRSGGRGPRTLGRYELEQRVRQAGFASIDFHYPFPDYKFPRSLATDASLRSGDTQVAEFVGTTPSVDHQNLSPRLEFDQRSAWHQLIRNRVAPDLANSFLVFAGQSSSQRHVNSDWDLASYAFGDRRRIFWTETRVRGIGGPSPMVERRRLTPVGSQGKLAQQDEMHETWIAASNPDQSAVNAAFARHASTRDIARALGPWVKLLMSQVDEHGNLPGGLVDAASQNVLIDDGQAIVIDNEWAWDSPLPAKVIIARGLYVYFDRLRAGEPRPLISQRPIADLMIRTAGQFGVKLTWRDLVEFCRFHAEFNREASAATTRWWMHVIGIAVPGFILSWHQFLRRSRSKVQRAANLTRRVARRYRS